MRRPSRSWALILNGDALTPALTRADDAQVVVRGVDDLTFVG